MCVFSDWLPTLMGLATGGTWQGSMIGATIDGIDMWDSITSGTASPRQDIVHYIDKFGNCSLQRNMIKLDIRTDAINHYKTPSHYFTRDEYPDLAAFECSHASLMFTYTDDDDSTPSPTKAKHTPTGAPTIAPTASPSTTSPTSTVTSPIPSTQSIIPVTVNPSATSLTVPPSYLPSLSGGSVDDSIDEADQPTVLLLTRYPTESSSAFYGTEAPTMPSLVFRTTLPTRSLLNPGEDDEDSEEDDATDDTNAGPGTGDDSTDVVADINVTLSVDDNSSSNSSMHNVSLIVTLLRDSRFLYSWMYIFGLYGMAALLLIVSMFYVALREMTLSKTKSRHYSGMFSLTEGTDDDEERRFLLNDSSDR